MKPSKKYELLLQDDGNVQLRQFACKEGRICTFQVKQTVRGGGGSVIGGRPTATAQDDDSETVYIITVENLGGGAS